MWTVLLLVVASAFAEQQKRVVTINQGPVVGYKDNGFDTFTFKNIPYATIPTGAHRFKAPLPPPSWVEPFDEAHKEILCPQGPFMDFSAYAPTIQEECLVASIYVPNGLPKNLPVVVYVHGGAFVLGFGNLITPKSLVSTKRMIAVTFNYRLGAHGFLCLGTDGIPGNAGMKDQVALLRWVQKNIGAFGGNPHDVTIAGFSAGSSSVDLLMLSKAAKGLFHRVIPESGANTAAFSIQSDPIEYSKEYTKSLGFNNVDDIDAMEQFLKNITLEHLNSVNTVLRHDSTFLVSPCVESHTNEEAFLEDDPVSILKRGDYEKLPMLYGFTSMDGLFRIEFFDTWKDEMNKNFSDFLPADLQFEDEDEKQKVATDVKRFYFGDGEIGENNILSFVDYFTDVIFAYPTLRSVKLQVEAGNSEIYLYEYSHIDEDTAYVPHTHVKGAAHCAQTRIVLDDLVSKSKEHDKMRDIMRKLWLNFITTGKPTHGEVDLPNWRSVGADRSPYMILNRTLTLGGSLLKERAQFWDGIYEKYYRWPISPIFDGK